MPMPPNRERMIGRVIRQYQQVGSTNDLVRAAAQTGEPEGLVIIADEQTAGRGRRGHQWAASPGSSLLCSVLLRPTWLPTEAAFTITMLAGVAVCEAVELQVPELAARLKWPNDLLLSSMLEADAVPRKAAGILCELVANESQIMYIIVGIGVNVNGSPVGMIDGRELHVSATSLSAATRRRIDRDSLREHVMDRLDTRYSLLRRGQREALFAAWRGRLTSLGSHVTITTNVGAISGLVEDVERNGALVLRNQAGERLLVHAGEVSA